MTGTGIDGIGKSIQLTHKAKGHIRVAVYALDIQQNGEC